MPELAAVVLAAGAGRRFGGPKALGTWRGATFLERVTGVLAEAEDVGDVVVVLGAEADRVRGSVDLPEGTHVVVNEGWDDGGMLSSIVTGLDAVLRAGAGADGLLVWPVDHPAVRAETVAALCRAFLETRPPVAVPAFEGRHGHPVVFGPKTFEALRSAPAEEGARAVVHANAEARLVVDTDDPGVVAGVDRPSDLERL